MQRDQADALERGTGQIACRSIVALGEQSFLLQRVQDALEYHRRNLLVSGKIRQVSFDIGLPV